MSKRKKHDEELKKEERDGRKHNRRMIGQTKGEEEKKNTGQKQTKRRKVSWDHTQLLPLLHGTLLPSLTFFFFLMLNIYIYIYNLGIEKKLEI